MHRIRLTVRENRLLDPTSVQPADYESMLRSSGCGWVAEVHDRIVGFAIIDLTRRNVWALFVDPDYERRGIGRDLHDTMMRWLCDQGVEEVWLRTEPGTRAEKFYLSARW